MAIKPSVSFTLELIYKPSFLDHIEIGRQDDEIIIKIMKTDGSQYAETKLSIDDFNEMADTLLKP